MTSTATFRALAIGHIAIGLLLMPLALVSGAILAPVLIAGPIWGIVLGVRLWRSGAQVFTALRRTHWTFLLIDGLLVAYGIFALRAAERSAARGGGLLGGFGLIPLGLGVMLACFSGATLLVARQAVPGKNGVVQQWSGRVATLPAPEVTGKGFITNATDLALFWRLWKSVGDVPLVNFDKYLILVATARSSVLQVRAIQVDAEGDLKTVVVATPDMTADYAVVVTLAERQGVRTVHGQPIE